MPGAGAIWVAGVLGVAVLRHSWGRPARSRGWNLAGWGALAAAIVLGAISDGAWGIAVASCAAIATALLLLAKAGFEQPHWRRSSRAARNVAPADDRAGRSLRRRFATFFVAGPLALAASVLVALAIRLALVGGGAGAADANVAVLGLVPLVWPLLAFALLMIERRLRQFALLVGVSALAAIPVFAGGAAA